MNYDSSYDGQGQTESEFTAELAKAKNILAGIILSIESELKRLAGESPEAEFLYLRVSMYGLGPVRRYTVFQEALVQFGLRSAGISQSEEFNSARELMRWIEKNGGVAFPGEVVKDEYVVRFEKGKVEALKGYGPKEDLKDWIRRICVKIKEENNE